MPQIHCTTKRRRFKYLFLSQRGQIQALRESGMPNINEIDEGKETRADKNYPAKCKHLEEVAGHVIKVFHIHEKSEN